ncbi:hypothetical protein [Neobacillus vireti]|uniref:hypothetical protein n=1 Tax=Neobacillus vireti TaxID=220686 RepID=UPI00040CAC55|nr:hypothetical protein [Neobacillus vireti]
MTENILKFLEKKGMVIPEHKIQPLMAQWDAYQLLNNIPNVEKLTTNDSGLRYVPELGR